MAPQLMMFVWIIVSLTLDTENHGQSRRINKWNTAISLAIFTILLWWGGFWNVFLK